MSDRNLAVLVRQLALHCNLAAQIQQASVLNRDPYSSNWLERLRQIKRIRDKAGGGAGASAASQQQVGGKHSLHDFTRFVLRKKEE